MLFHLDRLEMGSRVDIKTNVGGVSYQATARRVYRKTELPQGLFTTTGRPRLVLIICGGPFDEATHHYADNVVVYAVPM